MPKRQDGVAAVLAEPFGRGDRADVGIGAAGVREVRFGRIFVHCVAAFVAGAYSVGVLSMPALGHLLCMAFFNFFLFLSPFKAGLGRACVCAYVFSLFSDFVFSPALFLSLPFFFSSG